MRVQVSARKIELPQMCPCCLGGVDRLRRFRASRTTGVRVTRTTTRWWDFPYCDSCIVHVGCWQGRNSHFGLLGFPALITFFSLVGGISPALVISLFLPASAGLLALAIRHRRRSIQAARTASHLACVTLDNAVEFQGWEGSVQIFRFANECYALDFMKQNRRKLVNVHPAMLADLGLTEGRAEIRGDG
jgi:hypothetical protein